MGIPLLLILAVTVTVHVNALDPYKLPASIHRKVEGFETFVSELRIGMPPTKYKVQVSFAHDQIILYDQLNIKSVQWSDALGGSDVLHVSGDAVRVPIALDPYRQIPEYRIANTQCLDCMGIMGLGRASIFWRLWPDIGFTRGGIQLGTLHGEFNLGSALPKYLIHCSSAGAESLCVADATLNIKNGNFSTQVEFALTDQNVQLPADIYDAYMGNKNVFADKLEKWDRLHFKFLHPHALDAAGDFGHLDIALDKKSARADFDIEGKLLVVDTGMRRISTVERVEKGRPVRLGTQVLRNFVWQWNALSNSVLVGAMPTNDYMPTENLILFAILFPMLVAWRITDILELSASSVAQKPPKRDASDQRFQTRIYAFRDKFSDVNLRNRPLSLLFEFIGTGIAIAAYVLPATLEIVKPYTLIYVAAGVVLGVAIIFKFVALAMTLFKTTEEQKCTVFFLDSQFETRVMRALSHEIILLTGLWLLLVARRIDGLSTIPVFLVSSYAIFIFMFYLVLIAKYYILRQFSPHRPDPFYFKLKGFGECKDDLGLLSPESVFVLFSVVVGLLLVMQGLATVNYFYPPMLTSSMATYNKLIWPILVFSYLFLFTFANYITGRYIKNWNARLRSINNNKCE